MRKIYQDLFSRTSMFELLLTIFDELYVCALISTQIKV